MQGMNKQTLYSNSSSSLLLEQPETSTNTMHRSRSRRRIGLGLCLHSILLCCFHFHSRLLLSSSAAEANRSPDFSPSAFSYRHRHRQTNHNDHNNNDNNDNNKVNLGTTLVAIKYSGGVVVGADTRTSVGGYVSNKFAYKINPIFQPSDDCTYQFNDDERKSKTNPSSCVLCRSGSAADTQWLAKQAQRRFRVRRLERPGYHPSVSEVAHYLRYRMRDEGSNGGGDGLQASLICAGYDAATNGGQIFGITPGGSLWEEDNFCVSGSGSTILLGYLDDFLQTKTSFSSDLTRDEAIALVTKLLRLSIGRDGSSGGLVRLYVINEDGLEEKTVYPFMEGDGESTYSELEGFATPGRR